jgi:hypothetical protein
VSRRTGVDPEHLAVVVHRAGLFWAVPPPPRPPSRGPPVPPSRRPARRLRHAVAQNDQMNGQGPAPLLLEPRQPR